eukprot:1157619-Pelagomonas_calceolata.AAC.38
MEMTATVACQRHPAVSAAPPALIKRTAFVTLCTPSHVRLSQVACSLDKRMHMSFIRCLCLGWLLPEASQAWHTLPASSAQGSDDEDDDEDGATKKENKPSDFVAQWVKTVASLVSFAHHLRAACARGKQLGTERLTIYKGAGAIAAGSKQQSWPGFSGFPGSFRATACI